MFQKWNSLNFTQRFALSSLLLFLLVTPITVYLALSPTNPFSKAGSGCAISAPGCDIEIPAILALQPDIINVAPNQTFNVDIMLDTGSNNVTAAEIVLTYDSELLHAEEVGVTIGDFLPVVLEEPAIPDTITLQYPPPLTISFAVGSTAETPISGYGKIATIKFKAQNAVGSTALSLADGSQVAAIYKQVNVASNFYPASVHITEQPSSPSPTAGNLKLNLKFEGVGHSPSASPKPMPFQIPVNVEFYPEATPSASAQAQTSIGVLVPAIANSDGSYTASVGGSFSAGPPLGVYTVYVGGPAHLRKILGVFGFDSSSQITAPKEGALSMQAGDIINNNKIDIFDYNIIVQDFGIRMPASGSPADLDFDGDVDIFDYNLVVQNFGKVGD